MQIVMVLPYADTKYLATPEILTGRGLARQLLWIARVWHRERAARRAWIPTHRGRQ